FDRLPEQIPGAGRTQQGVTDTYVLKFQRLQHTEHVAAGCRDAVESFNDSDDRSCGVLLVRLLELFGGHTRHIREESEPIPTRTNRLVDLYEHSGNGGADSLRLDTHRRQGPSKYEAFRFGEAQLVSGADTTDA